MPSGCTGLQCRVVRAGGPALAVVGRWVPVRWAVAAGLFAGLGAALTLLLVNQLHWAAALVVAAGVGTQAARLAERRGAAGPRLVRRSLPWLAGSVCLIAILTVGWRSARECLLARSRAAADPGSPNVILLILDSVRAANLSLYGYPRPTTPKLLERFAQGATVFDRAFAAAPWSLPSHASIFTGRRESDLEVDWRTRLGDRWPTLAEALHARGYATAAFVANTEYASWESGLARGFEHYADYPLSLGTAMKATAFGSVVYPWFRRTTAPVLSRLTGRERRRLPSSPPHRSAQAVANSFLDWLDRRHPSPFFVFLNLMDAHDYRAADAPRQRFHTPETRPASRWAWSDVPPVRLTPADVRMRKDAYDDAIRYLDREVADLIRELDQRQLLTNTVVIITADHGEEFAEHGLVSHGHSLYRLTLGVPLVIRFPGRVPAGKRVGAPVSLQNLAATILDLTGPGRTPPLPGRSLARFWTGEDTNPEPIVASTGHEVNLPDWYPTSRGGIRSIAFDRWRYIRNEGDGAEELYDFENDILERWNVMGTIEGNQLLPRYRAAAKALGPDRAPAPPRRSVTDGSVGR
jgi:arylsulfatase A-like enzyme